MYLEYAMRHKYLVKISEILMYLLLRNHCYNVFPYFHETVYLFCKIKLKTNFIMRKRKKIIKMYNHFFQGTFSSYIIEYFIFVKKLSYIYLDLQEYPNLS